MVKEIKKAFQEKGDATIAKQQSKYMKNKFPFYGLKSRVRREIQRPFVLQSNLPEKKEAFTIVNELWKAPERELHYFAMELLYKYKKSYEQKDLALFEQLIVKNAWWDSIDFIAPKIVGAYFLKFPEERKQTVDRWIKSGNIWLQRSAILFQLKYKDSVDKKLLTYVIDQLKDEKEFFIRKAIGWILREVSKRDPEWVLSFTRFHRLQPLSEREALKVIGSK